MSVEAKILRGTVVRGDQLRLPRSQAIYVSASIQPHVVIESCKIKSDGSEIINLRLTRLEIPEEPFYPIKTEESVSIVCHKEDLYLPEVYATRQDFPIGLPHSNAKSFLHPVSICVSDVAFADMRMQFNAFDFIQSIRLWFELNSINQLHESDRPLEIFFIPEDVCMMVNEPETNKTYIRYEKVTDRSSKLFFVEKNMASHYLITIQSDDQISNNFAQLPRTVGDLKPINTNHNCSIPVEILRTILASPDSQLKIKVLFMVKQKRDVESESKYTGLFLISLPFSIREVKHRAHNSESTTFEEWFNSTQVRITFLLFPVVQEMNSIYNGVKRQYKKVCLVGVGTLGSIVADHFARMGVSDEIVIIDNDYYFPHNFARHTLPSRALMMSKATGVKNQYVNITGQKIRTITSDIFALSRPQESIAFESCDLIIDMSTSIAVERMLALNHNYEKLRKCTAFLNPRGDELVVFMEDRDRENRLDLLEMSYYRELITNGSLAFHLSAPDTKRTNQFSCRSESSVINYDNVGVLASVASQQIKLRSFGDSASIGLWHIDGASGEVKLLEIKPDKWECIAADNYSVFLCDSVKKDVLNYLDMANADETGGCIFGCYDRDRHFIYVLYLTAVPEDSICTPVSFVRGTSGVQNFCNLVNERTYHQVRYLGEWHSHPHSSNHPSTTDDKQYKIMSSAHKAQDIPFVQMIVGDNGLYVRCCM